MCARRALSFYGKKRQGAYPVACWRPRKPSATRSFCIASTSSPVAPSYKSRTLPRFPPVGEYPDERDGGDEDHLLGVPLGPAAAARTGRETRRETTARLCNGAMPDPNVPLGLLLLIARLAPTKAGSAVNDTILVGEIPSQLAVQIQTRSVQSVARACRFCAQDFCPFLSHPFKKRRKQTVLKINLDVLSF